MTWTTIEAAPPGGADDGHGRLPQPRSAPAAQPVWEPLAPGALGAEPTPTGDDDRGGDGDDDDDGCGDDGAGALFAELPPPPLTGPLAQALAAARADLDDAAAAACCTSTLTAGQRLQALSQVAALRDVTDGVLLRLVATFTAEEVRTAGATCLVDLVITHTGASPARAKTETTLAAALTAPPLPTPADDAGSAVQDPLDAGDAGDAGEASASSAVPVAAGPGAGSSKVALGRLGAVHAAGEVSTDVAALAARTVADLPATVRRTCGGVADVMLAEALPGLTYPKAQIVCATVAHRLDPDRADRGFDPDDLERRRASCTVHEDGWVEVHALLEPTAGAAMKVALDHLSKPDPTILAPVAPTDDPTGPEAGDASGGPGGSSGTDGPTGPGGSAAGGRRAPQVAVRDPRTAAQRRADALAVLARQGLSNTETRGGEPPRVIVNTTPEQLAGEPGAGQAVCESTGRVLTRAQLLHLACSGVLQAVRLSCQGPEAAVLSLGRAVRLFTASQRRAMLARDGGCVIAGCTAPPGWLEAHHVIEWAAGGPTDVDHGVLVCTRHHVLVTLGVWQVRMVAGVPQVRPPVSVDPLRRWVLNPRRALVDRTARRAEQLLLLHDPPGEWAEDPPDRSPAEAPPGAEHPAPDIPSPHGTCTC